MSRSYKHTARSGDKKDRFMKNYANRKLRRMKGKHLMQHNSYKKNLCSYNICDYETIGTTFEQHWAWTVKAWYEYRRKYGYPFPDYNEEYKNWYKWYKRK